MNYPKRYCVDAIWKSNRFVRAKKSALKRTNKQIDEQESESNNKDRREMCETLQDSSLSWCHFRFLPHFFVLLSTM